MTNIRIKFRASTHTGKEDTLAAFAHALVEQLRAFGKKQTADNYQTAINSFMRFRNGRDVPLCDIDSVEGE